VKPLWSVLILSQVAFAQNSALTDSQRELTDSQREGRRLFQQKCAVCHVPSYPGATTLGPGLPDDLFQGPVSAVRDAITNGLYDQSVTMPGWKYTLSSKQIDDIIRYLKSLPQPPETVVSDRPER
jgi:mono/diheme cytochrome c family protein